jgi:hypothetical protein
VDKATLVGTDLDFVGRVLSALRRARIPVTLVDWIFVPQLDEWQLVIASPWHDTKGPHETYTRVVTALQKEGTYQDVPIRRVFVRSPSDPRVKELEQELKTRTEGVIFIDEYERQGHRKIYSIKFAPFAGPSGAVPAKQISGVDELRNFLGNQLNVRQGKVQEALDELDRQRNAWIPNVQLSQREAKSLGLM